MTFTVRRAHVEDASALGAIHVAAWQAAYTGIMPESFLEGLDPVQRAESWRAGLEKVEAAHPGSAAVLGATFVVSNDGHVIGMATVGHNRDLDHESGQSNVASENEPMSEPTSEPTAELWMLNISPDHWGTGAAMVLERAALRHLVDDGHRDSILWVVEGDTRARKFYERQGWHFEDETKSAFIGGTEIVECRYRAGLDARFGRGEGHHLGASQSELVLHGEGFRLRTTVASDGPALIAIRSTEEVMSRWRGADLEVEFEANLVDEKTTRLTIESDAEGIVGLIQFGEENDLSYRHASLDIYIDPCQHRRGFAGAAIRTLSRYLFTARGHHRLTIDPAADNVAAIGCYTKAGFVPVGVMRRYQRQADGQWADGLLMELVAPESSACDCSTL